MARFHALQTCQAHAGLAPKLFGSRWVKYTVPFSKVPPRACCGSGCRYCSDTSLSPDGAKSENRTRDLLFTKQLLSQLSYFGWRNERESNPQGFIASPNRFQGGVPLLWQSFLAESERFELPHPFGFTRFRNVRLTTRP